MSGVDAYVTAPSDPDADGDGMPDGFSSRSFNSQLWDKARSEASKELTHARKKDGTWRKGFSESIYMTKLNQIAKRKHRRLKKEIIE